AMSVIQIWPSATDMGCAPLEVDDPQARMGEPDSISDVDLLVVRPTMSEGGDHDRELLTTHGARRGANNSSDSAHKIRGSGTPVWESGILSWAGCHSVATVPYLVHFVTRCFNVNVQRQCSCRNLRFLLDFRRTCRSSPYLAMGLPMSPALLLKIRRAETPTFRLIKNLIMSSLRV